MIFAISALAVMLGQVPGFPNSCAKCGVISYVDVPSDGTAVMQGALFLAGWGFECESGQAVDRVDVFYQSDNGDFVPAGGAGVHGNGELYAGLYRPDVQAAFAPIARTLAAAAAGTSTSRSRFRPACDAWRSTSGAVPTSRRTTGPLPSAEFFEPLPPPPWRGRGAPRPRPPPCTFALALRFFRLKAEATWTPLGTSVSLPAFRRKKRQTENQELLEGPRRRALSATAPGRISSRRNFRRSSRTRPSIRRRMDRNPFWSRKCLDAFVRDAVSRAALAEIHRVRSAAASEETEGPEPCPSSRRWATMRSCSNLRIIECDSSPTGEETLPRETQPGCQPHW